MVSVPLATSMLWCGYAFKAQGTPFIVLSCQLYVYSGIQSRSVIISDLRRAILVASGNAQIVPNPSSVCESDADVAGLSQQFLDAFQYEARNNLKAFTARLWQLDSDVFIFMARKAACFFDSMRELGLAGVRSIAFSDKILDMDISFLQGKHVTLVDDCVFTGTTLYNARQKVLSAGCSKCDTLAMAINRDSIRHNLLPGGIESEDLSIVDPVAITSDSNCVRLCYDIVKSISLIPRPYDVDFPQSCTSKVSEADLNVLLRIPGWKAFDVSSDYQLSKSVHTYSLLPEQYVKEEFLLKHRGNILSMSIMKIRLYTRKMPSGSWSIRIVPMVVFPEMRDVYIDKCLREASSQCVESGFDVGANSSEAKYRILHFMFSHALLNYFCGYVNLLLPLHLDAHVRHDLAEMAFGVDFWSKYRQVWPDLDNAPLPYRDLSQHAPKVDTLDYMPITIDDPVAAVSEAIKPFTCFYKNRELEAREYVRQQGLSATLSTRGHHISRLNEGVTPEFFINRLQCAFIDMQSYMSITLDKLVDYGVAVPTTIVNGQYLCRGYRHGEDAIFGEGQKRMLLRALDAYLSAKRGDFVWGLELQKFIVLFVQIGIRKGIVDSLNLKPYVPVGSRIVSIKGHLHGLIPTSVMLTDPSGNMGAPFMDGNTDHPSWLVHELVRDGNLIREHVPSKGYTYKIGEIPSLSLDEEKEMNARNIGRCLGAACADAGVDADRDFVLFSTCDSTEHLLRALSGEIAIFKERWSLFQNKIKSALRKRNYIDANKYFRNWNGVFTAVNSGTRKYKWYISGTFNQRKQNVHDAFRQSGNGTMYDMWSYMWPQLEICGDLSKDAVSSLVVKSGRWLFSINIALLLLDYWIVLSGANANRGGFTEKDVASLAQDIKQRIDDASKVLYNVHSVNEAFLKMLNGVRESIDVADVKSAYYWCDESMKFMNAFVDKYAKSILDEATLLCNIQGEQNSNVSRGTKKIQPYPYAVFFETNSKSPNVNQSFHKGINHALENEDVEIYHSLIDIHNPWKQGRWVLFTGNQNSKNAVRFCSNVVKYYHRNNIPFRSVVLGQLAYSDAIKMSNESNMRFASGTFFMRLAQLYDSALPSDFSGTVSFINEARMDRNEIDKYIEVSKMKIPVPPSKTIKCSGEMCPEREYRISFLPSTPRHSSKRDQGCVDQLSIPIDNHHVTILLCTATRKEDDALRSYLKSNIISIEPDPKKNNFYQTFFVKDIQVHWVRSGMGSYNSDGSGFTTLDAIADINPDYVISCGIALGHDSSKQNLGDVLISQDVQYYELGKIQPDKFVPRGQRIPADERLLQIARAICADVAPVRCSFGTLLSGEKLVNSQEFKDKIWEIAPEAIGADMEGTGIVGACTRKKKSWIIVKAISDWGVDKTDFAQDEAAANAVKVVFAMLTSRGWPA